MKKIQNTFMTFILTLSFIICLIPLLLIIAYLLKSGFSSINLAFFINNPKPFGEEGGGMLNAITGTLMTVGLASAIGIPFGLFSGIFLVEYRDHRLAALIRLLTEVLQGLPSIVVGIVAYAAIVLKTGHYSAYAGGLALAIMMFPIITRSTEEVLLLVPPTLKEAALALGAPRWRTTFSILLRTALGGIVGGVLSSVARVAGETAPLLFTAFGNRFFSINFMKPVSTMTLQIYDYARTPYESLHQQAWAAAIVLVFFVFVNSLLAKYLAKRLSGRR
jgi:phosphate transport system permease protein